MSLRPRKEIESLDVCVHGGPDYTELKELGLKPEDIIDFSVNSNPYSFPPGVAEAVKIAVIDSYPDSESAELRDALAERNSVSGENILVGSGSMEIIRLISQAYLKQGNKVVIPQPTFGEYETACSIAGAAIIKVWSREEDDFKTDIESISSTINKFKPKAVFICNPNNPTGQYIDKSEVEKLLNASKNTLFILDEAYIAFTEKSWHSESLISKDNIIIVRSMTKDYALAGLRLGYAIAKNDTINNLKKIRPPWNINAVAQKAGTAALKDGDYLKKCEVKIIEAKKYLAGALGKLGYRIIPSRTNFFLMKVNSGKAFRKELLKYGLMVRDCNSFGLPQYVRISPRTMPECQKLVSMIIKLREEGKLLV